MKDQVALRGVSAALVFFYALLSSQLALAEYPGLLRSEFSSLCVEVAGAATSDGAPVEQSACDGADQQVMDFLPVNGQVNVHQLRFRHAGKCLEIPGADLSPGADAQLASCTGSTEQHFELIAQANGTYQIQAIHSGLLIGLAAESSAEGIVIEQQSATASAAQTWRLANHDYRDPAVYGRWGDVIPWPQIAVSAASLPDGRILTFSGSERETWPSTERTYSSTWDPETGVFEEQTHVGHNMFCAHLAMAADGRVFVNGGRNQTNSPWTSLFHYQNNQWVQIENMSSGGRWYPTTLALADGDMFTAIGTATNERNPDRWDEKKGWKTMTGIDFQGPVLDYQATHGEHRWWSLLHLAPQGKIFHSGPTPTMGWINTTGNGQYEDTGIRQSTWYHKHGTSIMYDEGKIINAGGWAAGNNTTSTNQAFTVDLTGPSPLVQPTGSMVHNRKFHNGVMTPLGDVLVVGGNTSGAKFSDNGRVLSVEFWDPASGLWDEGAEMTIPRNYHSVGLLLTDGRVLSAGSGYCSNNRYCSGASHRDGQVYEPPYLFNGDGSYATRPVISTGPGTVEVGSVFNLATDTPVAFFSMIKMGATTHGMNTDVRYLRPGMFDLGGNSYQLTASGNPNVLSPGYWMVFAVDAAGVPSKAHVVLVTTPDVGFENVALSASVSQSSTAGTQVAALAVDGDMTATAAAVAQTGADTNAWWEIDLNSVYEIDSLRIWSRTDCCPQELENFYVLVSDEPFSSTDLAAARAQNGVTEYYVGSPVNGILDLTVERTGRYVRLQLDGNGPISLAELQVFGTPPGAGTPGLVHYEYYEGTFAALPDFSSLTPVREGIVDGFRLSPALAADGWAMRYYGQLDVPVAGLYTFYTNSSDGSRLLIDGVVVVDNDGIHGPLESSGSVSLNSGSHDIVVEYFDNAAAETLTVSYEGPGITKQEIPVGALALLPAPGGTGEVLREWWTGLTGTAVSTLTGAPGYPDSPSGSDVRSLFEAPINWADNYGTRMRGFVYPPFTGYYTFWISSDDGGELWLSTDEQPTNASLIANVPGWSSSRQWDKFPEQQSAQIFLQRGQRYFIEALQKEQGGGDNLAVAWQPPTGPREVIDGAYLSQFSTPLSLLSVDTPAQVTTGSVVLTVNVEGDAVMASWSFGDGTPDTPFSGALSVSHDYPGPGRYTGSVTIRDISGQTITQNFQQIVHAPLTAGKPNASSGIVYHMDRAEVWSVNPDNDSVAAIDANADALIVEIPVAANPRGIAVASDWLVWVTSKDTGAINVLDPSTQAVIDTIDLGTGTQPHGIVADPAGTSMYVALEATGEIVKFDALSRTEIARASVGEGVRHLSISADGTQLLASLFVTPAVPGEEGVTPLVAGAGGVVRIFDSSLAPVSTALLQHSNRTASEHSGPGLPNYLGAATITPDGLAAWIPSKQDNILRGTARNGLALVHDQTVRAISSKLDLGSLTENFPARIDHDNASVAGAAVFGPFGSVMYTSLEGNREIAVSDVYQATEILRFDVGRAPQGLAISPSGDKLFVQNFMDRTVSIHDLSSLQSSGTPSVATLATIPTVATETLTPNVLTGKQFFYDARDPRLASQSYMSCASCHNDGGQDGRIWDFTQFGEGIRNTITLRARGIGHGNAHWTANFDEIQDFEGQIRAFALGSGLMSDTDFLAGTRREPLGDPKTGLSADLDALAAYANSLTEAPASPYREATGELTSEGQAGRDLFITLGCGSCHSGSELTDSATGVFHDVGTITPLTGQRLGDTLPGLDTPSLLALNGTGPFLHDGSAATLKEAVLAHTTISMLDSEATSIAAFLTQIDPADLVVVPVTVPDVTALPQAAAEAAITTAGFVLGSVANQYSSSVPAGDVISQDPLAGTSAVPGSAINLVVSDGPQPQVAVPDVVNLAQGAAESSLTAAGLVAGVVSNEYSSSVAVGAVISQNPIGGLMVDPGTAVDLVISDGPEPLVLVPDVVGITQGLAESAITGAGLLVGTVDSQYSSSTAAGDVISQDPVAGSSVASNSTVNLVVSLGPVPVSVPDVVGIAQAAAEASITGAGLVVGTITNQHSSVVAAGSVISHDPVAGTEVLPGAAVNLLISDGPAPVTVPALTGLTQATAEASIVGAGLTVGAISNTYSSTVPAGAVVSQNPTAGTNVSPGTGVDLVISDGPAPVAVPAVAGLSQPAAEAAITGAGLSVGGISNAYSSTVAAGSVISQSPTAGTNVSPGTGVDLVISDGPAPVAVPAVTGLSQPAAEAAITGAGLSVGGISNAYSSTVAAGSVISQSPSAGTNVSPGTAVDLVISDGPAPVAVPAVTGLSQPAAEAAITGAGLSVGGISNAYSSTVAAGSVISQSPSAGTNVSPGTAVDLVISDGPAPVAVPAVTGLSQPAAEAAITGAGLSVGGISNAYSSTVAAGSVISQSPTAGTNVSPGTAVDLVISDGPAPVAVPAVAGLTQAAAEAAITGAGLSVGGISNAYSSTVAAGSVISQSPSAGTNVLPGTAIDLVISDGPAPVPVPAVTGLAQTAAEAAITGAGLTVGAVTTAFSTTVPAGDVISQNPTAGTNVLPGTAVALEVSDGPASVGPNLTHGSVTGVGSSSWQTVTLPSSYVDMVVVATAEYGKTDLPVVTRIRNASANSFELRVQNPSDTPVSGYTVRYVVVEAGTYNTLDHGVTLEAAKVAVTVTDEDASWVGEAQSYANTYSNPVVLGQVMTENDSRWSVFWASDGQVGNPPSASSLYIGKHVAEDTDVVRSPETVGYIVLEAGAGSWDGLAYVAGVGADIVEGVVETAAPYLYPIGFFADTAVLSSAGMDGTNGGWPVLHADQSLPASQLGIGIDEDQINDSERDRTNDQVAYLAIGEIVAGTTPNLASGVVTGVGDSWQTVTLPSSYTDPVVVATPEYASGDLPVVTRIRNAGGNQFELRVQNPAGTAVAGYTVRYVAVEAGVYTSMNDGIQMEAVKYTSTRTDDNNAWVGEARAYANSYTNPVVLGQVMSFNDAAWSVFWTSDGGRSNPPSAGSLYVGKHVAEDPSVARADETVGYIVLEAGTVSVDGVTIAAGLTSDNIKGPDDGGQPFNNSVPIAADNVVLSAAAMDGGNGGWPVLDQQTSLPGATIAVIFEEDQIADSERRHTTEQAAYLVVDE